MAERILIVEDDEDLQEIYRAMLADTGYELAPAYDGLDALERLEEAAPDLILLDIVLDEMMGDDLFMRIKADPRFTDIPVVVVSVFGAERCREIVAADPRTQFLRKPFRSEDLVAAVRRGLAQSFGEM